MKEHVLLVKYLFKLVTKTLDVCRPTSIILLYTLFSCINSCFEKVYLSGSWNIIFLLFSLSFTNPFRRKCSISIPPENFRKPEVMDFSRGNKN